MPRSLPLLFVLLASCGGPSEDDTRCSRTGESCTTTDDCCAPDRCIALACVDPGADSDSDTDTDVDTDTDTDTDGPCVEGDRDCNDELTAVVECSGGEWVEVEPCPVDTGYTCNPDANECVNECDLVTEGSGFGCQYWPVDLPNITADDGLGNDFPGDAAQFAVVVANPSSRFDARVTIYSAGDAVAAPETVIGPHQLHTFELLRRDFEPHSIRDVAYRVGSNRPVVAYQFNPLTNEPLGSSDGPFSNDASMLLPTNALSQDYYVLGRQQTPTEATPSVAFMAIVATEDGTDVEVTLGPSTTVQAMDASLASVGGGPGDVLAETLDEYDVWQIVTTNTGTCPGPGGAFAPFPCYAPADNWDTTGTLVRASAPVAVFAGTECSRVPDDRYFCDHLEEQVLPVETWGQQYVATRTDPRGVGGETDHYRVLAAVADTRVTTVPLQSGFPVTLGAGEWHDFTSTQDFVIETSNDTAFLVGQYIMGPDCTRDLFGGCSGVAGPGDPFFLILPPVEQFRTTHVFLTPDTYDEDFVNVVAPDGAAVTIDDAPLAGFAPVGGGEWRKLVQPLTDGPHVLESDVPVGIVVYGWSPSVSYGYVGGLDTERIFDPFF